MRNAVPLAFALLTSVFGQDRAPYAPIEDVPDLPRVLLIGDSISVGYTLATRELLRGVANVHRIPENGGPTIRGIQSIDRWLGDGRWDVIHFNWGLHDVKYLRDGQRQVPVDVYEHYLERLVRFLRGTGAELIWASTTPVPEARVVPPRKNADVVEYNAVAAKVMQRHAVAVNDLYAYAVPRLAEIQREANVHFLPEGSRQLAQQVAASIRQRLPQP